ncbi:hypothetical protein K4F52_009908 [Lecanicillium sp. MT-2017a]|nr:hypothetical protein K4F52_009908 [Lecanicillium sp. MT-2017a]
MDLPVPSPTKPFWHQDGHRLSDHRSTEEIPTSQDVLVIGAGFTGASCAYYLSHAPEAPASLTVLEAREACSGATGRNGGHMRPESLATFAKFADKINMKTVDEIAQFEIANLIAVQELVQELNIDCDFEQIQSANAYLDENLAEAAKAQQRQLADAGFDVVKRFKYHDETTAPAVTGVRDAKGAMTFPAACLWPYQFVMDLLSASVAKGVNLQTHTPVLDVSKSPDSDGYWTVNTARGTTKAKKIIFATNGYTRRLLPEYAGHIIPVRGICSHTVADTTPAPALAPVTRTMGVKHSPGCQDYLISRPDGSIVVGGAWKVVRPGPRDDWHDVTDDSKLIPAAETY